MIAPDLQSMVRPIASLHEDPRNARQHDDRNLAAIAESLHEFGQRKPIVALASGEVVAGNGTLRAAQMLGWDSIAVATFEDEGKARAFAIADNQTAVLATWDESVLARTLSEMSDDLRAATGFDGGEIDRLVASLLPPADDEIPPVPEEPETRLGDMYLLGTHRVLCGDSTKAEDVARLMNGERAALVYTDPPYGVDYDGGTKVREKLSGDDTTALYGPACAMAAEFSDERAALYLWHAGIKGITAAAAAAAAGYEIRCELIWNKNQAQFGALSAQYKQKHEPAYYCFKRGTPPRWFGPTNEVTVWDIDRAPKNEFHPTQKPVELAVRAMANSSEPGGLVLDLFLGSGATLIAAEQTGRRCYGMELAPAYCDVIVARWAQFTGKTAERVRS